METDITIEIRGIKYPVQLSTMGTFSATDDGGTVHAEDTLDKLRATLLRVSRQSGKVAIRFSQVYNDGRVRYGTITGIHAGNRDLMVKWDDGSRHGTKISSSEARRMTAELSEQEAGQYKQLRQAASLAANTLAAFLSGHRLDGYAAAQAELAAKSLGEG